MWFEQWHLDQSCIFLFQFSGNYDNFTSFSDYDNPSCPIPQCNTPTYVGNSDHAQSTGNYLLSNTLALGGTDTVVCDNGYTGGGIWTCDATSGQWTGASCTQQNNNPPPNSFFLASVMPFDEEVDPWTSGNFGTSTLNNPSDTIELTFSSNILIPSVGRSNTFNDSNGNPISDVDVYAYIENIDPNCSGNCEIQFSRGSVIVSPSKGSLHVKNNNTLVLEIPNSPLPNGEWKVVISEELVSDATPNSSLTWSMASQTYNGATEDGWSRIENTQNGSSDDDLYTFGAPASNQQQSSSFALVDVVPDDGDTLLFNSLPQSHQNTDRAIRLIFNKNINLNNSAASTVELINIDPSTLSPVNYGNTSSPVVFTWSMPSSYVSIPQNAPDELQLHFGGGFTGLDAGTYKLEFKNGTNLTNQDILESVDNDIWNTNDYTETTVDGYLNGVAGTRFLLYF